MAAAAAGQQQAVGVGLTRSLPHPCNAGPWKTCELNLCEQFIGRRRLSAQCTPITITCDYNQTTDKADCDTTGWVKLGANYIVTSTAIKADGVRKSITGQTNVNQYSLPYYP